MNWIVCRLGVGGILLWLLFPIAPESQMTPHTFSPRVTLWLQEHFGTEGLMAWFASLYYYIPMITNVALFFFVMYYAPRGNKGRDGWIYGICILLGFLVELIIYLVYPVAPPIRVPDYLKQGIVQVRLNKLPWSDKLITLKYNALPSGHMIYSILGYLVCQEEGFTKPRYFYLMNTMIFSFIILYLGEHYWIDIISSFIVAIGVFSLPTRFYDLKIPKCKTKNSKTK
ncbi:MAG: phosphatase PAP2 family protein [Candidatus Heimdallarchaeota archaeon]